MKNLKWFWSFIKGNRALYLLSILSIGAATFINFIWPVILRITIDSIIGNKELELSGWMQPHIAAFLNLFGDWSVLAKNIWICSLLLIFLTLIRGLFLYFKGKWSAISSESIAQKLRDSLYDHIQNLPYSYHVKVKTGDLIQRCTSDVNTIRRFLAMQFVQIGRALFMITFALSFMLPMHKEMTLISMLLIPVIFSFTVVFFIKVKRAFKLSDESEAELSTVLQENLSGVRLVKAFARQSFEIDKFDAKNKKYRDLTYRLIRLLAWYWSTSDFFCLIQIGLVLFVGTLWATRGIISLGMLLAFTSYVGMLLWPIRQMGRVLTDMGKTFVSIDRIREILDEPCEKLKEGKQINTRFQGKIEFDNVYFEYEKDKPILNNVSFKVKPGETIAFLGPTGSGKSTLLHLLPRLYDYQSGSIKIDGKELKEINKMECRRNIGIVLQEPFLFSKTVKENIALAKSKAEDEEVFHAASIASIHDVLNSFENGYETLVGEKGATLSGGQKQRIAIARTLLNETPVLLFDDSLSAVDTETDAAIRQRLKKRNKNTTTFIVSHRINTVAEADRIFVLEDGKLTQQGTHTNLVKQTGLYRKIWRQQNKLEEELKSDLKQERNIRKSS